MSEYLFKLLSVSYVQGQQNQRMFYVDSRRTNGRVLLSFRLVKLRKIDDLEKLLDYFPGEKTHLFQGNSVLDFFFTQEHEFRFSKEKWENLLELLINLDVRVNEGTLSPENQAILTKFTAAGGRFYRQKQVNSWNN